MSTVTLPSAFVPTACMFSQTVNQRVNAAPFGGSEQAVDLLNDRWKCSLQFSSQQSGDGAWLEAFIAKMRGQVNVVSLYHFARKTPRGTLRGTLFADSAAQGASSLSISGCSPSYGTLLEGDLLGVGGLLVMVADDCAAYSGSITVPITNRLRYAVSGAVTWDRPTTKFRLLATSEVQYVPGNTQPVTLDFGEAI